MNTQSNAPKDNEAREGVSDLEYKVVILQTPIDISQEGTVITATVPELIGAKEVVARCGGAGSIHLFISNNTGRGQARLLGSLTGYYASTLSIDLNASTGGMQLFHNNFATGGAATGSISEFWYR